MRDKNIIFLFVFFFILNLDVSGQVTITFNIKAFIIESRQSKKQKVKNEEDWIGEFKNQINSEKLFAFSSLIERNTKNIKVEGEDHTIPKNSNVVFYFKMDNSEQARKLTIVIFSLIDTTEISYSDNVLKKDNDLPTFIGGFVKRIKNHIFDIDSKLFEEKTIDSMDKLNTPINKKDSFLVLEINDYIKSVDERGVDTISYHIKMLEKSYDIIDKYFKKDDFSNQELNTFIGDILSHHIIRLEIIKYRLSDEYILKYLEELKFLESKFPKYKNIEKTKIKYSNISLKKFRESKIKN